MSLVVVVAAADAAFAQRVRAVLARPDGDGVLLWDKPLNAAADVQALADRAPAAVILGPKLGKEAAFNLASYFDRNFPAISVLVVAVPGPDTWQRALNTGTRGIISPVATDDELRANLNRVLHAARGRAGAALGLLAGSLGGCGGAGGVDVDFSGITFEKGWECTAADAWQVRGFDYSHFASAQPGELLTATVRRGDVVPLELTNRYSTACGASVASVQWRSSSPDVAAFATRGPLGADLRAESPGETRVSAEVTLTDGSRHTAELHAVPSHGSPVLRVYAVRVVR